MPAFISVQIGKCLVSLRNIPKGTPIMCLLDKEKRKLLENIQHSSHPNVYIKENKIYAKRNVDAFEIITLDLKKLRLNLSLNEKKEKK